jgi:hypothetical protein
MLEVKLYDNSQKEFLEEFCAQMKNDGFMPWSSLERLRVNKTTYFIVYHKNKIIAINGTYKGNDDTWFPCTRTGCLKAYRNYLVPTKTFASTTIPIKLLWLPCLQYALDKGAQKLLAHLNFKNTDTGSSQYYSKKTERLIKLGLIEYDGIEKINGIYQDKFILLMPSFKNWLQQLNDEPIIIRKQYYESI